jgi:hypothetical protein
MKKLISTIALFSSFFILLQSCDAQKVVVNREVESTSDGKMLLGTQTISQFQQEPYNSWYKPEYDAYKIDAETLEQLKKEKFKSYTIQVFLGTWCGDSHRNFPRFMKIADELKYPESKMTIVTLNRKKESPNGEEAKYNIQRVPTIIISKYGKEIGRIIENPTSGYIEKDLLEIIKKDDSSIKDLFKK